jgi:hypothetical protein
MMHLETIPKKKSYNSFYIERSGDGIFEWFTLKISCKIGGNMMGIGSSEEWRIQRIHEQRNSTARTWYLLKDLKEERWRRRWLLRRELGFRGGCPTGIYRSKWFVGSSDGVSEVSMKIDFDSWGPSVGRMLKLPRDVGSSDLVSEVPMNINLLLESPLSGLSSNFRRGSEVPT